MPSLLLSGQARRGDSPDTLLLCGSTVHGLHPSLRDALIAPGTLCSLTIVLSDEDRWVIDVDQPIQLRDLPNAPPNASHASSDSRGDIRGDATDTGKGGAQAESTESAGATASHSATNRIQMPTRAFARLATHDVSQRTKHTLHGLVSAHGTRGTYETHRESHQAERASDRHRGPSPSAAQSARATAYAPQPGDPF
jgi:hypothetical protein